MPFLCDTSLPTFNEGDFRRYPEIAVVTPNELLPP
jgi:hypothetical protein